MGQKKRERGAKAYLRIGLRTMLATAALMAACGAPTATAAGPVHAFLSALDASQVPQGEFDHACGVAVDSAGDAYVANAGKGSIDVFAPDGAYITSIADPASPCSLAVDSVGNLYALNTTGAAVVVFSPQGGTYPPAPAQPYTAAATVDGSGLARSIAVNPDNDHLFINQRTKVVERKSLAEGSGVLNGGIGEGVLTEGFGVGVWGANGDVYASDETGVIYVFDPTGTKVRAEIDGAGRPGGAYTTLPEATLAVDQSNGHVLVSDVPGSGNVDEWEASGTFVTEITHGFVNAEPSGLAVDPREAPDGGRIYVTSGSGAGSQVFTFAPLITPSHPELPQLSPDPSETPAGEFQTTCGTTVDSQGDVYVANAGTSSIDIYAPEGSGLKYIGSTPPVKGACWMAVDSAGNLYVSRVRGNTSDQEVLLYPLSPLTTYPFTAAPVYGAPKTIYRFSEAGRAAEGLAVDLSNDHLFVARENVVLEYESAANGSSLLRQEIALGLGNEFFGLAFDTARGMLYIASNATKAVLAVDPAVGAQGEARTVITGGAGVSHKPDGPFSAMTGALAVDESTGHVYVNNAGLPSEVYEFEASGAYVSRFNRSVSNTGLTGIAVDNSGGPDDRVVFVAGGASGPPRVDAYGPAVYGEAPGAATGPVTEADGGEGTATLAGSVNPHEAEVEACKFEYVTEEAFEATGFAGAAAVNCAESPAEIGSGVSPVAVHAQLTGLSSANRYYYRLSAGTKFGTTSGAAMKLGLPEVAAGSPSEVLSTEAVLEAPIDPWGLETTYRCEFGPTTAYGSSTPAGAIGPEEAGQGRCVLSGLQPGTTYHFTVVASNPWGSSSGADATFTTPVEVTENCPNASLRTGRSRSLPDCRAYELVTPILDNFIPRDQRDVDSTFPAPLASPSGEDLIFSGEGAIPGTADNGAVSAYRSHRGSDGWSTGSASPTGAEMAFPTIGGFTPSHDYAFWTNHAGLGSLAAGGPGSSYLRLPDGSFQLIGIGEGSLVDPRAIGRWISEGGGHVVFTSTVHLAATAPPSGVRSIYDRDVGGSAQLVSAPPSNASALVEEEFATRSVEYLGISADGSAVAFRVGPSLYVRRAGQTIPVATGEVAESSSGFEWSIAFEGLSADGRDLFYAELPEKVFSKAVQRGELFMLDLTGGAPVSLGGGDEAVLVNVSPDGSRAYFASPQQIDGNGAAGEMNLYRWSRSGAIDFLGIVATGDIESPSHEARALGYWAQAVGPTQISLSGFALDPTRTTADGGVIAFESAANLTSYDSDGKVEVYLYSPEQGMICVSCNPEAPPTSGATLEGNQLESNITGALTVIPNLTSDGAAVFFETTEGLVSQDRNQSRDVYEWRGGRISLISGGSENAPSFLFGASADGRDVFFVTTETLLPSDQDGGGYSVYDARIGGGFPTEAQQPCRGAECRSGAAVPPTLSTPGSSEGVGSGNVKPGRHCPRGKHLVRKRGKAHCAARKRRRGKHKHHRGKHKHRSSHGRGKA